MEIHFDSEYQIDTINVYGPQDSEAVEPTLEDVSKLYALIDFDVDYWDGSEWESIYEIRGNDKVWTHLTFDPITTAMIRIKVLHAGSGYSRIVQVEAMAAKPENYLSTTSEAYIKNGIMLQATCPTDTELNAGNRQSPTAEQWEGSGFNGALYFESPLYNSKLAADLAADGYDFTWGMCNIPDASTVGNFLTEDARADTENLTTVSINDEIYYSERASEETMMTFEKVRTMWPHILLHTNQIGNWWATQEIQWDEDDLRYYIRTAKPDILTYDDYVFSTSGNDVLVNDRILEKLELYRKLSLEGWDGTGDQPISFGQYLLGCFIFQDELEVYGEAKMPDTTALRCKTD